LSEITVSALPFEDRERSHRDRARSAVVYGRQRAADVESSRVAKRSGERGVRALLGLRQSADLLRRARQWASPSSVYDVERPRYKRPPKGMPAATWKRLRGAACDELIHHLAALANADPSLDLRSHPCLGEPQVSPKP